MKSLRPDLFIPLLAGAFTLLAGNDAHATWPEPDGTVVYGDFDGDGTTEIAVSSPELDCDKGAVHVLDPDTDAVTTWTRDSSGVLGTASCGDLFGAALVSEDFDGDGHDDLAIGAPGAADSGVSSAGAVHVLYGSATGLTASGDQLWHQDSTGISDSAESEDDFGSVLGAGDFNCDGDADLVIGVPMEKISSRDEAGAVHVLYGSTGGLTGVDDYYVEGYGGVDDNPHPGDHFGAAFAAGNFNGDDNNGTACLDLAIAAPDEHVSSLPRAGFVYVIYGNSSGLSTTGDDLFHQDIRGAEGGAEEVDRFGARVDVVDRNADGYDDLTVTVPGDGCASGISVGRHLFYGSSGGLTVAGDELSCEDYACPALETDDYGCRSYSPPVWGTSNSETFQLSVGNNLAWGGAGNDTFYADHGDDVVFGGVGNDVLDGGPGRDLLIGGDGDDLFIIDADCEAVAGEVIDGGEGTDQIRSHLTLSELAAAGVEIVSIESYAPIAEHPLGDDHCVLLPFEEGPFNEPVVKLVWSDLPNPDSILTTRAPIDLEIYNTADVAIDVDLTYHLLVRGQQIEQTDSVSLSANSDTTVSLDLEDFIPGGINPYAYDPTIPVSATITTWGDLEASGQPFGRTFAPTVYGHLEQAPAGGSEAVLYREEALHDTYNDGDLGHLGTQHTAWSGVRLQRVEAVGSLGIPGY